MIAIVVPGFLYFFVYIAAYGFIGIAFYHFLKWQTSDKDEDFLVFLSTAWPLTLFIIITFRPAGLIYRKIKRIKSNLKRIVPPTEFCKRYNEY